MEEELKLTHAVKEGDTVELLQNLLLASQEECLLPLVRSIGFSIRTNSQKSSNRHEHGRDRQFEDFVRAEMDVPP